MILEMANLAESLKNSKNYMIVECKGENISRNFSFSFAVSTDMKKKTFLYLAF